MSRRGHAESRAKRVFDVGVATLVLLLAWPLIALGALLVVLTSPGPALYRARRAGRGGRPFDVLKLRTMVVGADAVDRRVTEVRDERVTPVGRFLRRSKIDELPQFWNVLRGDMSVVGPRPEDVDIVARYYGAEQRRALAVRPGIASPADLLWYPDLTYHDPPPPGVPMQEHYVRRHMPALVAEAIRYVEDQSLWLDLKVLVHTAFCVLFYSCFSPARRPLPEPPRTVHPSCGATQ